MFLSERVTEFGSSLLALCNILVIGIWLKTVWDQTHFRKQEQRSFQESLRSRLVVIETSTKSLAREIRQGQVDAREEMRSRLNSLEELMRTLRRESTLNRADITKLESRVLTVRSECRRNLREHEARGHSI